MKNSHWKLISKKWNWKIHQHLTIMCEFLLRNIMAAVVVVVVVVVVVPLAP